MMSTNTRRDAPRLQTQTRTPIPSAIPTTNDPIFPGILPQQQQQQPTPNAYIPPQVQNFHLPQSSRHTPEFQPAFPTETHQGGWLPNVTPLPSPDMQTEQKSGGWTPWLPGQNAVYSPPNWGALTHPMASRSMHHMPVEGSKSLERDQQTQQFITAGVNQPYDPQSFTSTSR